MACEESLSGKNEDINLSTRTGIFPIFKSITTKMMLDNLHTHVIVPDNQTPVEVLLIFNGGFMYVSAIFGGCRPGGATSRRAQYRERLRAYVGCQASF